MLGFLAQITISPLCGVYLRFNTNKAEEANGWTQAPQHHHAELAEGRIIYCDEPNNTTWLIICDMHDSCTSTWEQAEHLIFEKIDGTRIWYPSLFNVTWHDTYELDGNICIRTYEPLAAPPKNMYINGLDDL